MNLFLFSDQQQYSQSISSTGALSFTVSARISLHKPSFEIFGTSHLYPFFSLVPHNSSQTVPTMQGFNGIIRFLHALELMTDKMING